MKPFNGGVQVRYTMLADITVAADLETEVWCRFLPKSSILVAVPNLLFRPGPVATTALTDSRSPSTESCSIASSLPYPAFPVLHDSICDNIVHSSRFYSDVLRTAATLDERPCRSPTAKVGECRILPVLYYAHTWVRFSYPWYTYSTKVVIVKQLIRIAPERGLCFFLLQLEREARQRSAYACKFPGKLRLYGVCLLAYILMVL